MGGGGGLCLGSERDRAGLSIESVGLWAPRLGLLGLIVVSADTTRRKVLWCSIFSAPSTIALSSFALAFFIFYEVRNFLPFLIHTYIIIKAKAERMYIAISIYMG